MMPTFATFSIFFFTSSSLRLLLCVFFFASCAVKYDSLNAKVIKRTQKVAGQDLKR
jgi:hypothetical protein